MCDNPQQPLNEQHSYRTYYGKVVANFILNNVLSKNLKILVLQRKYIEMCFHSNQHPQAIKHTFISLYSKYQSLRFICLPVMNSPVFPSLDHIFCMCKIIIDHIHNTDPSSSALRIYAVITKSRERRSARICFTSVSLMVLVHNRAPTRRQIWI